MLKDNVLSVADDLRSVLSARGLAAEAKRGGLLAALVSAAAPTSIGIYASGECDTPVEANVQQNQLAVGENKITTTPVAAILAESSLEKTPVGGYRHGAALEESLKLVCDAVRVDHDFARNGVNPVIRQIVDAVEASENSRAAEVGMRPDLVPYFYADLWESASWNALVKRYEDQPIVKVVIPTPVQMPADSNLFDLVSNGLPGNDEALKSLLQNHSEQWLGSVYAAVFCNDSTAQYDLGLIGRSEEDGWLFAANRLVVDAVTVAFLMARSLLKLEPTDGYNAGSWEAMLSTVIGAAGQRLWRSVKQRAEDRAAKQLVFTYDYRDPAVHDVIFSTAVRTRARGAVVVNGDLYNEYLEQGGSPEALMGAAYHAQERKLDQLLVLNDQLLAEYRRHEAMISERFNAQRFTRVLDAVRTEVMKYISTIPPESAIRSREDYVAAVKAELELFATRDIGALWYFVRRLVCRVFFPHTNALRVLEKIDEVAERMPDASVQTTTYHATIEILIDWLWAQVEIKKLADH